MKKINGINQSFTKNIVNRSFIIQTAADYAMKEHEVEKIFNLHPGDGFYQELEKFIEHRAKSFE